MKPRRRQPSAAQVPPLASLTSTVEPPDWMLSPLSDQSEGASQSHSKPSTCHYKRCKRCHGNSKALRLRSAEIANTAGGGHHTATTPRRSPMLLPPPAFCSSPCVIYRSFGPQPKVPSVPAATPGQPGSLSKDFFTRVGPKRVHDGPLPPGSCRPAKTNMLLVPTNSRAAPHVNSTSLPRPPYAPYAPSPAAAPSTGASMMTPLPAYQIKSTLSQ